MRARIVRAVTRFQAIWRGYLYKKAFSIALQQQREYLAAHWLEFQKNITQKKQKEEQDDEGNLFLLDY